MKPDFFDRFSKDIQITNFIKVSPVRAELFHVDRHTANEANSRLVNKNGSNIYKQWQTKVYPELKKNQNIQI